MKHKTTGWAIDTVSKEGHGFLGKYYGPARMPKNMQGYKVAVWPTRAMARGVLSSMKGKDYVPWPKARVRKVQVTVEVIE